MRKSKKNNYLKEREKERERREGRKKERKKHTCTVHVITRKGEYNCE